MKRGVESNISSRSRKKHRLKHSVELTIDELPAEMLHTIFSQIGFDIKDLYRASQVSRHWHDQLQIYAIALINKYFPYLKTLHPNDYQDYALPFALSEICFFKDAFPEIDIKLILAALQGDKLTINAITDDSSKATLIGIMLSNSHSLENIDDNHKSTVCDVGFKLSANNGNIDLMKKFQTLKGQPITTAPEALENAARRNNHKIVRYLKDFDLNEQDIDAAVSIALLYEDFDMAFFIQQNYFNCDDVHRMLRHAVKQHIVAVVEIILKTFVLSNDFILRQLFNTSDLEIFTLLLSEHRLLADADAKMKLFPSTESYTIWNFRDDTVPLGELSLLERHAILGNTNIVNYYLSLYDAKAWDWRLAQKCKEEALILLASIGNYRMIECLLDNHPIPLRVEALQQALRKLASRNIYVGEWINNTYVVTKKEDTAKLIQRRIELEIELAKTPTVTNAFGESIASGLYFTFGTTAGYSALHATERLLGNEPNYLQKVKEDEKTPQQDASLKPR